MSELFINATRLGFRFKSVRGLLTTEQVWELPLTSKDGFDLDTVAKQVNSELKQVQEESFVETVTNPAKPLIEQRLEVVKHIIAVKIAEQKASADKAERRRKRAELLDAIQRKEAEELSQASRDDLLKKLAELDD